MCVCVCVCVCGLLWQVNLCGVVSLVVTKVSLHRVSHPLAQVGLKQNTYYVRGFVQTVRENLASL